MTKKQFDEFKQKIETSIYNDEFILIVLEHLNIIPLQTPINIDVYKFSEIAHTNFINAIKYIDCSERLENIGKRITYEKTNYPKLVFQIDSIPIFKSLLFKDI